MTINDLRKYWDWSNTRSDMILRVTRAIWDNLDEIQACNGPLKPTTVITWCDIGCQDAPLWHGNFSFRNGLDDMCHGETALGIPTLATKGGAL
jgi:hypothetical protein